MNYMLTKNISVIKINENPDTLRQYFSSLEGKVKNKEYIKIYKIHQIHINKWSVIPEKDLDDYILYKTTVVKAYNELINDKKTYNEEIFNKLFKYFHSIIDMLNEFSIHIKNTSIPCEKVVRYL